MFNYPFKSNIAVFLALLLISGSDLFAQNPESNFRLISEILGAQDEILSAEVYEASLREWNEQKVRRVRLQSPGLGEGSFQVLFELDENGKIERAQYPDFSKAIIFRYVNDRISVAEIYQNDELKGKYFTYYDFDRPYKFVEMDYKNGFERILWYDPSGNIARIEEYSGGDRVLASVVKRNTDENERLISATWKGGELRQDWNSDGRIVKRSLSANDRTTEYNYEYNTDERLARMEVYRLTDSTRTMLAGVEFEYNGADLLASWNARFADPNSPPETMAYRYDQVDELVAVRGDMDGIAGYGTPLIMKWLNPIDDVRTTKSSIDLKFEVKPGPAQTMPEIKELRLMHNQKLTEKKAGQLWLERGEVANQYFATKRIHLDEGFNSFTLNAVTTHSTFSAGDRIVHYLNPDAMVQASKLTVLAIGVSQFANDSTITGAGDADAFEVAGKFLYQEGEVFDNVDVKLMLNEDATLENIRNTISKIRSKSSPGEIVVVYFSGHGESSAETFHLKPYDVDHDNIEESTVSTKWLAEEVSRFAGPAVVLLDAARPVNEETPMSSDRIIGDFAKANPDDLGPIRYVLLSTSKDQVSLEDSAGIRGLFTKGIAEALTESGDEITDGIVTFREIRDFVETYVSKASEKEQKPAVLEKGVGMLPIWGVE